MLHQRQNFVPSLTISRGCCDKQLLKVPRWWAIPETWGHPWSGEFVFHLHQAQSSTETFNSLKYQIEPKSTAKYSSVSASQKSRLKRHLSRNSSTWMTYSRHLPVCSQTTLITSFLYIAKPHVPQESIQTDWKFYLKPVTTDLAHRCDNRLLISSTW